MKFELGQTVMTRGVANSGINKEELNKALTRHCSGDWGDLGLEDKEMNDEALESGEDRILSAYVINGEKLFIITEWDRSVTTIMFASEY